MADVPDAPYRRGFDPDSSYGSAVRLVQATGATSGAVLDLGCGYGPVAEPLRDLGLTYIGLDLDGDGLADLAGRGFETAQLDLELPAEQLEARLAEQLAGRPLVAVLALDALEHVRDPWACTTAVARLARGHAHARLVLSLPNVTHVDVAGKLLLGRWDVRTTGLLDHTHVQFFDEARAVALATSAGWLPAGADDVDLPFTEQLDPSDAPQLRPGSPLNELLRTVRRDADPHATTYQFVRSYALAPSGPAVAGEVLRDGQPAAAASVATVVVAVRPEERGEVLHDLGRQTVTDFRVVVLAHDQADAADARVLLEGSPLHVRVAQDADEVDALLHELDGRYVCTIRPGERVDPEWIRWFSEGMGVAPGRVIVAGCRGADGEPLEVARFDLIGAGLVGVVPGAAYAIPAAAREAGVMGHGAQQTAHTVAGLARAAMWCGRYDLDQTTCTATEAEDLAALDRAVALVLDEEPLLLAPGAASPLAMLRSELQAARHTAEQAQWARQELQVHVDAYIAASDAERQELHRKVAAMATPGGVVRITARRAASIVKRRVLRR